MLTIRNFALGLLLASASLVLKAETQQPNFELYNTLNKSVFITLENVAAGHKGSAVIATEVKPGKGNQFQTQVESMADYTRYEVRLKFWERAGRTRKISQTQPALAGEMLASYLITVNNFPYTIYLTVAQDAKTGKISLAPQTGRFGGLVNKTESGLSLEDNISKHELEELKGFGSTLEIFK